MSWFDFFSSAIIRSGFLKETVFPKLVPLSRFFSSDLKVALSMCQTDCLSILHSNKMDMKNLLILQTRDFKFYYIKAYFYQKATLNRIEIKMLWLIIWWWWHFFVSLNNLNVFGMWKSLDDACEMHGTCFFYFFFQLLIWLAALVKIVASRRSVIFSQKSMLTPRICYRRVARQRAVY